MFIEISSKKLYKEYSAKIPYQDVANIIDERILKILPTVNPGVSLGTKNNVPPRFISTFALVRASKRNRDPTLPLAMKHLSPFSIQESPSLSALSL